MKKLTLLVVLSCFCSCILAQQLFQLPTAAQSRVSSFENLNGSKGNGGKTNKSAKGNSFEYVMPGETKELLNIKGSGIIQRIWLTIDQTPAKLRSLRLQMFWDNTTKPAVDVPLGDFFVYNSGIPAAFQSALFSSGEGRSFNCFIPMPFYTGARVVLINEGTEPAKLYFDIDFLKQQVPAATPYFHAYWNRQISAKLGTDYEPLPKVNGKGRFLGMSVGLITDTAYGRSWYGEGEIKMYMDDDMRYPTIAGTGLEDYLGSAWCLGKFTNMYTGCTVSNDSLGKYTFYRFHIPDAIYFEKNIRVTIQQIGGWGKEAFKKLLAKGVNLQPVTIDAGTKGFTRLLDEKGSPALSDKNLNNGWVNFYRVDDYSSVAYFYLNKPFSNLPGLPELSVRMKGVKKN